MINQLTDAQIDTLILAIANYTVSATPVPTQDVAFAEMRRIVREWMPVARYSHRNGESNYPTICGLYWYRGRVKKPGQKRGNRRSLMLHVFSNGARVDDKGCDWDCFAGDWWGPVSPPWETSESVPDKSEDEQ